MDDIHWRCILGVAPAYLSELVVLSLSCPFRRSLRSASHGDYLIPRSYTSTKQNRAFSAAGPSIWNGLPFELRSLSCDFSSSFYSLLKTFLFARAWAGSQWRIQEFSKEGPGREIEILTWKKIRNGERRRCDAPYD